eukprot:614434_1
MPLVIAANLVMIECNHNQFLYIVSVVIEQMHHPIKECKDDAQLLYRKALIVSYLHYCKRRLDGMSFQRPRDSFVRNIKGIVFETAKKTDLLTERLKHQYTNRLYDRINSFQLGCIAREDAKGVVSIRPSSAWLSDASHDDSLRQSSVDILSTLNQYQHSSYLMNAIKTNRIY